MADERKAGAIANDLAMEITVGGDRFDRNDLFFALADAGMERGALSVFSETVLEKAKGMQPDGHESGTVEFFRKALGYWLDADSYGLFLDRLSSGLETVCSKDGLDVVKDTATEKCHIENAKTGERMSKEYCSIDATGDSRTFVVGNDEGKKNFFRPGFGELSPTWFDSFSESTREGVRWICRDGLYNHLDMEEQRLVSGDWASLARDFHDGWAVIKAGPGDGPEHAGKFNYINHAGDLLSDVWLDNARDFRSGMAIITVKGEDFRIDTSGSVRSRIIPAQTLKVKETEEEERGMHI